MRDSSISYGAIAVVAGFLFVTLAVLAFLWFSAGRTVNTTPTPSVADTIPTTEPDEATSKALIVFDGATQLRRDPGVYGSFHVAYALTEKHPASNAIQQISSRLKALGWTPIQGNWLNPGQPSSHVSGWIDYVDGTTTPMRHVYRWDAQWRDKSGNIVDYGLTYSYLESGTPDLQSLWINGSWFPAASVKIMQKGPQEPDDLGKVYRI